MKPILLEIMQKLDRVSDPFGISLGYKILEQLNSELSDTISPGDKFHSVPIFLNLDSESIIILHEEEVELKWNGVLWTNVPKGKSVFFGGSST